MASALLSGVGLVFLAYHLLTSRGGAAHSDALMAVSEVLSATGMLLYGVGRPFTKVSVATAAALVLSAVTFLLPGEFGAWRLAVGALLIASFIAWVRWVVLPKRPKNHVSSNRAQRRHSSRG